MKNFGKGIGGALLTLALIFGVFAVTSGTALAQRNDGNYRRSHQDRERHNRKQNSSQRRNRDGRDDRSNDRYDWRRNRNQDRVYNNGQYGNRDYGNNGAYGNNGGYNRVELDRGYQQGLNTGASDAQRGQSYDPQRSRYFKNPSSQAFREGFVRGYDQGYRQYSGYGNQRNGNGDNGWGSILGGILGRP